MRSACIKKKGRDAEASRPQALSESVRLLSAAADLVAPQRLRRERTGRELRVLQVLPRAGIADLAERTVPAAERLRIGLGLALFVAFDDRNAVERARVVYEPGAAAAAEVRH